MAPLLHIWQRLSLRLRSFALVAAILIVAIPVARAAEDGPEQATEDEQALVPRPSRGELERAWAEHREREAREREWRAGAEGRSERVLSRTAHRGAGRERALGLMRDEFPGLRHERSRPLDPPAGYRVAGFHSDRVARLEAEDGSPGPVISSTLPLRTEDDGGEKAPVDLAFEQLGARSLLAGGVGGFAPRNGLVGLRAPSLLNEGFALGRDGFMRMHVAGAPASVGTLAGNDVFYHEVAPDTDLLVAAMPFGFETFTQLRSPESPERLDFRFELPAGASVEATQDGGARLVRDGAILLVLLPPDAVDAQGQRLPARYVVSGATVELHAAHRDRDVAYPVAVDPIGYVPGGDRAVLENWVNDPKSWYHDSTLDITGWKPHSYWSGDGTDHWGYTWPFKFCSQSICSGYGNGLYVQAYDNTSYPSYSQGEWYFPTWGDVYIPRAEFAHIYFSNIVDAFLRASIWSGTLGRYTALKDYHHNPWWDSPNYYTAISSSSDWTHGTSTSINLVLPNAPGQSWQTRTYGPYAYLGGALIYLQDRSAPARPAVWGHPTGWVDKATGTFFGKATDGGLGVKWFRFRYPTGEQWREHPCLGDRRKPCPGGPRASSSTSEGYAWSHANLGFAGDPFTYDTTNWPEGVNTISMEAADATSRFSAPETRQIYVDHNPPAVSLSGSLHAAADKMVSEGSYYLGIDVSDTASDVTSVRLLVNEKEVALEPKCVLPARSASCGYTFDTSQHGGAGPRTFKVIVRDRVAEADHETIEDFTVSFGYPPDYVECVEDSSRPDWCRIWDRDEPPAGGYPPADASYEDGPTLSSGSSDPVPEPTGDITYEECYAVYGLGSLTCDPNYPADDSTLLQPLNSNGYDRIYGIGNDPDSADPDGDGAIPPLIDDPAFTELGVKKIRVILPYNIMEFDGQTDYDNDPATPPLSAPIYRAWAQLHDVGKSRGYQFLVSFGYRDFLTPRDDGGAFSVEREDGGWIRADRDFIPNAGSYRNWLRRFKSRFPGVKQMSPWNEPNHPDQPFRNKSRYFGGPEGGGPKKLARYTYLVQRDVCQQRNGCTVIAGDLADVVAKKGLKDYFTQFKNTLATFDTGGGSEPAMPTNWALHPYLDIKLLDGVAASPEDGIAERAPVALSATRTALMWTLIPAGDDLWFTEGGSHVDHCCKRPPDSGPLVNPRNTDASQRTETRKYLYDLARYDRGVERLYYYQFRETNATKARAIWDSGLVAPDGVRRGAYAEFKGRP